jgi:acyl-CoA reductase-like NAD-dependent aldehyde dehydrogenase/nicotinamidase-related amidase
MNPALLLIDLQHDFFARPGFEPPVKELIAKAQYLLNGCRRLGIPVLHAQTLVRPDGENRMPHWKRNGILECVAGTKGAAPPVTLMPQQHEPIIEKQFFSAFAGGTLETTLKDLGSDTLIIAGVYIHGCVRSTILDAYERGFTVWVAQDAIGSTESLHAEISRDYLACRAAVFSSAETILEKLEQSAKVSRPAGIQVHPVGYLSGEWMEASGNKLVEQRNPSKWDEVLGLIPLASPEQVASAAAAASRAGQSWRQVFRDSRQELLTAWAEALASSEVDLAQMMAVEVGKPISSGRQEVRFAIKLLRETASVVKEDETSTAEGLSGIQTRRCPLGVVGIITPWNNPVGIPVGKLGPAIAHGNSVVWKPALQAPGTTELVLETLIEAGLPHGVVTVISGGVETAKEVIRRPEVQAVSFTGSCAAGRQVAELCARFPKPLQAELGGNNAAIIMPDVDLPRVAEELATAAFGYAGQRCTATRRFIVHQEIRKPFIEALLASVSSLKIGDPQAPETQVGPVISREKLNSLVELVKEVKGQHAQVLHGGTTLPEGDSGCWFMPTVIDAPTPDLSVVQEESFGPIAVIQTATDLDDAITLLNGVPQGLVASLYSDESEYQTRFLSSAEAGVLKVNQATAGVDPGAPFGGWKSSGVGPPEHGPGDLEFYTRMQAVYGSPKDVSKPTARSRTKITSWVNLEALPENKALPMEVIRAAASTLPKNLARRSHNRLEITQELADIYKRVTGTDFSRTHWYLDDPEDQRALALWVALGGSFLADFGADPNEPRSFAWGMSPVPVAAQHTLYELKGRDGRFYPTSVCALPTSIFPWIDHSRTPLSRDQLEGALSLGPLGLRLAVRRDCVDPFFLYHGVGGAFLQIVDAGLSSPWMSLVQTFCDLSGHPFLGGTSANCANLGTHKDLAEIQVDMGHLGIPIAAGPIRIEGERVPFEQIVDGYKKLNQLKSASSPAESAATHRVLPTSTTLLGPTSTPGLWTLIRHGSLHFEKIAKELLGLGITIRPDNPSRIIPSVYPGGMVGKSPLFAELDPKTRSSITRMLKLHSVARGEVIVHRGDPADRMFFVLDGECEVVLDDRTITLGSGECFGAAAILRREAQPATVRAAVDSALASLAGHIVHRLIETHPKIENSVIQNRL